MKHTPASHQPHRLASHALIVLFVALLWLPTLDSLWHLDHCPPQDEKRKLADFPDCKSLRRTWGRTWADWSVILTTILAIANNWCMEQPLETQIVQRIPGGHGDAAGRDGWLWHGRQTECLTITREQPASMSRH